MASADTPSTVTGKATSTRPSRARKTTPAKATATPVATPVEKAAEPAAVTEPTSAKDTAIRLVLVHVATTKRFEVFGPDDAAQAAGIVGKLYFPLGTKVVKVLATE